MYNIANKNEYKSLNYTNEQGTTYVSHFYRTHFTNMDIKEP